MRAGIRLGVDVGKVRVGVAQSDAGGLLATPVNTYARDRAPEDVAVLARQVGALEVVVGLPLSLSGADTASTADSRAFAADLAQRVSCPVRLVDERLSTVSAQSMLSNRGVKAKKQRAVVDQVAAVIILQHSLDTERATGNPAGTVLAQGSES